MGRKRAKAGGEGAHLFQRQRLEVERARAEDAAEEDEDGFIPIDRRAMKSNDDEQSEEEEEEIFNLAHDSEEDSLSSGEEGSESGDESSGDVGTTKTRGTGQYRCNVTHEDDDNVGT